MVECRAWYRCRLLRLSCSFCWIHLTTHEKISISRDIYSFRHQRTKESLGCFKLCSDRQYILNHIGIIFSNSTRLLWIQFDDHVSFNKDMRIQHFKKPIYPPCATFRKKWNLARRYPIPLICCLHKSVCYINSSFGHNRPRLLYKGQSIIFLDVG